MKTLLRPVVVFVTLHLSLSNASPKNDTAKNETKLTNEELNKQIQALEKEEQDLYKNITTGIDDSLKALENVTGKDGEIGLKYLDLLKDDFKDIVSKSENITRRDIAEEEMAVPDSPLQDKASLRQRVTKSDVKLKFDEWLKTKKIKKKAGATKDGKKDPKGPERCPRTGKEGKGRTYPCCKDCCRQSYLGC
ncbi:uncharacterized protein LOC105391119 [Plutella xylostella]|uniref:uncharacterized protein LOC105391119 n=1 Tax=Plutella xylostella TaxID=51655 RepID=UPI00203247CE|nr:uncharacterized protein LOC105391119 [Plutella xylostella]